MTEPYAGPVAAQPSAPELMASELRRAIALGAFEPGARLPSERTLADRLGVSRMTIRAAMRILAQDGLVTTARGRTGGTIVSATASGLARPASASSSIDTFAAQVHDNLECRLVIEPFAAELAAARATEQERQTLRELVEIKANGIRHFRMLDSRLHMTIAHAAHNESLLPIIERLRAEFFLWADAAWTRLDWSVLTSPEQDFGHGHRSLVLAITQGDEQESRRLVRAHIEEGLVQVRKVIARVEPDGGGLAARRRQPREPGARQAREPRQRPAASRSTCRITVSCWIYPPFSGVKSSRSGKPTHYSKHRWSLLPLWWHMRPMGVGT
jgi:GntR family transcriptional regulator, transcriptional repressor for pyruvate dehydrogenase complex